MVLGARRVGRKRVGAPKRRVRKMRLVRPMKKNRTISDYATCSVATTIVPRGGGNFASNIMYSSFQNNGIKLSDFPRASSIAANYQHFKIKQVKLTLKWTYDTFQQGVIAGGGSRPNLYYMIDKSGSIPANVTLEGLKNMGSKPHTCDNRQFVITWRPAVLTEDQNQLVGPVASQYRISPWLATNPGAPGPNVFNPSDVAHNGIYWYVEQLFGGGIQYNAEMEVQFAFKKPLYGGTVASNPASGFETATLNSSSDGVVGGPDGV